MTYKLYENVISIANPVIASITVFLFDIQVTIAGSDQNEYVEVIILTILGFVVHKLCQIIWFKVTHKHLTDNGQKINENNNNPRAIR